MHSDPEPETPSEPTEGADREAAPASSGGPPTEPSDVEVEAAPARRASEPSRPTDTAVGALSPAAQRELPVTEGEIDSPRRLTLVSLAAVFVVTVVSWGSAKLSCNHHPPESRPPPPAATEKLAARPKDAAIELQQRWTARDFAGALELAQGGVADAIRREQAECAKSGCPRDLRVVTTAVLHRVLGLTAQATVTSRVAGEGARRYDVELERVGAIWKVTQHAPAQQAGN